MWEAHQWSAALIGERCGVSPSTVYRVLRRNGVVISESEIRLRKRRTTPEQDAEIVRRYLSGESAADLAAAYGFSFHISVIQRVRAAGHQPRPAGGRVQPISDEVGAEILRLRNEEGLSQEETAKRLGIGQTRISRFLIQNGHRTWELTRHPQFNGVVKNQGGYVLRKLDDADPFFVMATVHGYVLEHRYVMARALGRPLTRSETVHHINGDRADNRLENLQLRFGPHGRGAVFRCGDCGSHNVIPERLPERG